MKQVIGYGKDEDRPGVGRRCCTRLGAHRRHQGVDGSGSKARHHRGNVDRRRRWRVPRRGPSRRARGIRADSDPPSRFRLPRFQPRRHRPHQRATPVRASRAAARRPHDRGARSALHGGGHRDRHRPRDLAVARVSRRCRACLLRAARPLPPREDQRSLAFRRRARQSHSRLRVPGARRALRHRRQSQLRRLRARHDRPAFRARGGA